MDGGDHDVEALQELVAIVDRPVGKDVRLGALEDPEARIPGLEGVDRGVLGQNTGLVEPVRVPRDLRVVGDRGIREPGGRRRGDHLLERVPPVGFRRVEMEETRDVGGLEEPRKPPRLRRLELAPPLAEGRRDPRETDRLVDFFLGRQARDRDREAESALLEPGEVGRGPRFRDERASERRRRRHDELGREAAEEPEAASRALAGRGRFGARKRLEEVLDGAPLVGRSHEDRFLDELASSPDVSRDLDRAAEIRGRDQVAQADGEARRFGKEPGAAGPGGRGDPGQDLLRARGAEPLDGGEPPVPARGVEVGERRDVELLAQDVDLLRPESGDPVQGREGRRETRPEVFEVGKAAGGDEGRDLLEDRRSDPGDVAEGPVGDRRGDVPGKRGERARGVGIGADLELVFAGQAQEQADLLQERGDRRPLQEGIPADPGREGAVRIRNLPSNASRRAAPGGRVKARRISRASRST